MEDDVLFQGIYFQVPCWFSGDYHNMYTICMNIYLAKLYNISPHCLSLKISGISLTFHHHLGAQNSCEVAII